MSAAENVAFEARGVSYTYPGADGPALDEVSLKVGVGEIFGLLGPNGAGKSTLMAVIANLITPARGEVLLYGHARRAKEGRTLVGMAPQELALISALTTWENLVYFGGLCFVEAAKVKERAAYCLDLVDLTRQRDQRVERLSGGMKRRLNLAVALMQDPRLLLLDEPTVGVDPQSRNLIFDKLEQLEARGLTIIYSTHYMEEAERLCDRVAIIDGGKILVDGPTAELTHSKSLEAHFLALTGRNLRE